MRFTAAEVKRVLDMLPARADTDRARELLDDYRRLLWYTEHDTDEPVREFTADEIEALMQGVKGCIVRDASGRCVIDNGYGVAAALRAFRDRLTLEAEALLVTFGGSAEAEARLLTKLYQSAVAREPWVPEAMNRAREEGQREVLREIAAIDPWDHNDEWGHKCVFCHGQRHETHPHGPNCLWLRAQEAAKQ